MDVDELVSLVHYLLTNQLLYHIFQRDYTHQLQLHTDGREGGRGQGIMSELLDYIFPSSHTIEPNCNGDNSTRTLLEIEVVIFT